MIDEEGVEEIFFLFLVAISRFFFLTLAALDLALALSIFPVAISNVVLYTLKEDSGRITVVRYFFYFLQRGGVGLGSCGPL